MTLKNLLFPALVITLAAASLSATVHTADASDYELTRGGIAPDPVQHSAIGTRTPGDARTAGVAWLASVQKTDGGWGAGAWGQRISDAPSDVATTAYVTLALLRDAGTTTSNGTAIRNGVEFVVRAVESQPDGPKVATVAGTQPQYKLGEMVDTHLATLLLGEVKDRYQGELGRRVRINYDLAVTKVQRAQQADGSFDANGWAPVLSTSIAAQSLYRAQMDGMDVDASVLDRADAYQAGLVGAGGSFDTTSGAGVDLYAVAGSTAANAGAARRERARGDGGNASTIAAAEQSAGAGISRISGDAALISGFGSIGGEEMLSYQMISDTLAAQGGEEWTQWNDRMGQYLASIQNQDGSWAGHHCITSPVFVTAGAVMTLSAEAAT